MLDKFEKIPVNLLDFEKLVVATMDNVKKLKEYFRLNLIYYQLISGKGLEFDRIKEYAPGSDSRRIDWRIYARTSKLFIRAYREERDISIIIIVDTSNSMLLGTSSKTKSEFASIVAGVLAFAAVEAGDKVGGGTFSDAAQVLIDPEGDFFNLLNVMSMKESYGGQKNWPKLTNQLITNYESDSIVFIISDFIDSNPDTFLPILAARFAKVYGIMVRDPADDALPRGVGKVYLKDPNNHKIVLTDINKPVREEYEVLAKREIENLSDMFHQYGQLFFKLNTNEDFSTGFIKSLGGEKVIIF